MDRQGSLRILKLLARILKDLAKDLEGSSRIFKDLRGSCQDLQRILTRSLQDPLRSQ